MSRNVIERNHLPVVFNPCPAGGNTKRQEVRELTKSLDKQYPGLGGRALGAMQGPPLPARGPMKHRWVPLPEEDQSPGTDARPAVSGGPEPLEKSGLF